MIFGIAVRYLVLSVLLAALIAFLASFFLVVSQSPSSGSNEPIYGNVPTISTQ
jgi:hypothetical protein